MFVQERRKRGENNNDVFLADIYAYQVHACAYSVQWVKMDLHVQVTCTKKNVGVREFVMCIYVALCTEQVW